MQLIDTHTHLDHPQFAADLPAVIQRAHDAGVTRMISIGTDLESSRQVLALTERFPSVSAAVGIHPTEVTGVDADWLNKLRHLAQHAKVVALGEIGIDYFHQPLQTGLEVDELSLWRERQAILFQQQLDLALELGLNVIIHQRDVAGSSAAWEETLRILKPYGGKLRALFHCFGGTLAQAEEVIALGHLVSFTGIVTFKNAPLVRATAAAIPATTYMVETDSPYLAPDPYRGQRAEPWQTRLVAERIAQMRGLPLEEVAAATTTTAEAFFRNIHFHS
jgi:TatD DNase family protein